MKLRALLGGVLAVLLAGAAAAAPRGVALTSAAGTKLHALVFDAERPAAGLLVVHGFQSHAGWLAASGTGDHLAGEGILTLAYDRRGSGRSGGRRGHTDSPEEFLQDFEAALGALRVELARAGAADAPVHALANCFGTRIVVPYAAAHPEAFASLILTSPATHMTRSADYGFHEKLAILAARDGTYFESPLEDGYFADEGPALDWIRADELGLRQATASFLKSTRELTGEMEDTFPELRLPLLVVLAREDVVVDNEKIKHELFAAYPGRKVLVELDGPHYVDFSAALGSFREAVRDWILASGASQRSVARSAP